jgi:hypothetical protein
MTFLVRECYGSPKISIKFVKICQNLLKFVKIRQNSLKFTLEECYDKVLNEEFLRILFCKMKNVITRAWSPYSLIMDYYRFLGIPLKVHYVMVIQKLSMKFV